MEKKIDNNKKSKRPILHAIDQDSQLGRVSMDPSLLEDDEYNVTLPSKIIDEMSLHDGDAIVFIKEDDGKIVMRKEPGTIWLPSAMLDEVSKHGKPEELIAQWTQEFVETFKDQ